MIHPGVGMIVLWGPMLPAGLEALNGTPLVVNVFRAAITPTVVETIIGNLRWDDAGFPVTVID